MDFLKTLMLYMSLTFAAGVQSAPTPTITPAPTPEPTAIVTEAPAEIPTAINTAVVPEITATAASAATPTPVYNQNEQPTITPNTAYKTLSNGDRGDRVKALQERLIELGYLTGEADGAFGGKTRKAVLLFQYNNGLKQDGVAGRATQTVLFESPNVVANPDAATPAPAPTEAPAPNPADTSAEEKALGEIAAKEETVPAEQLDEISFDKPVLKLIDADITINGSSEPLRCTDTENSSEAGKAPRVWLNGENDLFLDLEAVCNAAEDWSFTKDSEETISVEIAGHPLTITAIDNDFFCESGSNYVILAPYDFMVQDGTLVMRATVLANAFDAEVSWDAENAELNLQFKN